jgi:acetolactate synthase small subunit
MGLVLRSDTQDRKIDRHGNEPGSVTKGAQETEQLSKIQITTQTSQRSWSEVKNQVMPLHPKSRSRQEQRTIPFVLGKSTQSK